MFHSLTNDALTVVASTGAVAGTTAVTGSSVDTLGYDSVRFLALLGTLTATQVTSLSIQESADGSTNWTASVVTTTAAADADGGKLLIAEVYKPALRYVRFVLNRGTANAVLSCVLCELSASRLKPVTADATVSQQKVVDYV